MSTEKLPRRATQALSDHTKIGSYKWGTLRSFAMK